MKIIGKEKSLKRITQLVELFEENYESYKKLTYDETKTRGTFIDEFFEALGWDIDNKNGVAEAYRDVIPEYKAKVEGKTKAPDYCFTISGQKKFLVEAKKPSVTLKTDTISVFQLRYYGYHVRLPISVITNFEEFAIYDCTKRPNLTDKTSKGRIRYINYKEYIKEFDFIWDTFSREGVIKGRFDKFIKTDTQKRGTATVDTDFLDSLNEWRKYLASSIAKNHHRLTQEEVQYTVQQTIDRIIFLIFCEYRNIEHYGSLKNAIDTGYFYKNLFELFKQADEKYNSGLFDFRNDKYSDKLTIDNKVLKNIITELYPPESDYDFSIFPVEVLGNAYEQFLGKIIRITPGHIVKIEDKPEVKKAGGVYYTPEYIVDYIVRNTVSKLIQGKSAEQISKMKIVDPACGSGSFLLGAFEFLMNYHTDYYLKKGYLKRKIKNNPLTIDGRLTTKEKRKILLNNIFGVDIDPQAVEVTKLSLLLKAMEGETEASIKQQLELVKERVLPNIDENIKCGNSLVGYDFFDGQLDLNKAEKEVLQNKIKPFDWQSAFPEIFKQGGFNVVIGNPPYVDSEQMVRTQLETRNYCLGRFETAKGNWDLYCVFCEKGCKLLAENSYFGFIIPNKFLSVPYGEHLKKYFSKYAVKTVADYSTVSVFLSGGKKVNVYPVIVIVNKSNNKQQGKYYKMTSEDYTNYEYERKFIILEGDIEWTEKFDIKESLIKKIIKKSVNLSKHFNISSASTVSEAYEIKKLLEDNKRSLDSHFVFINTGTIDRYSNLWGLQKTQYIKDSYVYPVINKNKLKHLLPNRFNQAISEKLILAGMVKQIEATYDKGYTLAGKSTIIVRNKSNIYNLKYLLGFLNSKLFSLIFISKNKHNAMSGGYINVSQSELSDSVFKEINFHNNNEKLFYHEIIKRVDNLLQLNKDILKTRTPARHAQIKNQILYSDNRINELFFGLYGLTKKEIETINNKL